MEQQQTFTVTLTQAQLQKLIDVLYDHDDEGPMHEGWASSELIELRKIVENAVCNT